MNSYLCLIDPGWAQFAGSVAAIGAGWLYLNKQNKDEICRVRKRDENERADRLRVLIPVFSSLYDDLQYTAAKIRTGKLLIELEIRRLESYERRLMSLPLFDIPSYEVATCVERVFSALNICRASLAGLSAREWQAGQQDKKFSEAMELPFHLAADSVVQGFCSSCRVGTAIYPDFISDEMRVLPVSRRSRGNSCVAEFMEYVSATGSGPVGAQTP